MEEYDEPEGEEYTVKEVLQKRKNKVLLIIKTKQRVPHMLTLCTGSGPVLGQLGGLRRELQPVVVQERSGRVRWVSGGR
jgi:hypothetical protein